ncbi:uncharacterized protein [Euphorbia lathyris]|uniref:uncharacterized protein n=1 Tax=Euphorbia lathyris TaxID=212925 RepID=UPI0033139E8D
MEENEIQLEFNSFIALLIMTTSSSSHSISDPLFSCIITLYTLILIFYPSALKFFLSPVFILTSLLLLFLLRLGRLQNATGEHAGNRDNRVPNFNSSEKPQPLAQIEKWVKPQIETEQNATGEHAGNRGPNFNSSENSQSSAQIEKWVQPQIKTEKNVTGDVAGDRENRGPNFNSSENSQSSAQIEKWVEPQIETEQNVTGEHAGNRENRENRENRDPNFDSDEKTRSLTEIDKWVESQIELGFQSSPLKQKFEHSFVEWNVRAPLEVIYEAYEGEEEDDDQDYQFSKGYQIPSLSMYYPETDSDSSSDDGFPVTGGWDSPESVYLKWEEEDRDGMLIEIAFDSDNGKLPPGSGFHFEEDNLIEIDISPCGNDGVWV